MSAGQRSGTGAKTELDDEMVRKNDILSNRDKSQRPPGRDLDGKGVQVDEYKDIPTNRRTPTEASDRGEEEEHSRDKTRDEKPDESAETAHVDRPGFDLGGSTGETDAGKGLGLGDDAKKKPGGLALATLGGQTRL